MRGDGRAGGVDGGGGDVRLKLRSEKGGARPGRRSQVCMAIIMSSFKDINADSKPKICSKQNPNTAYIPISSGSENDDAGGKGCCDAATT